MDALTAAPPTPEDADPSKEAPDNVAADPVDNPAPVPPTPSPAPDMATDEEAPDGVDAEPVSPPPPPPPLARSI